MKRFGAAKAIMTDKFSIFGVAMNVIGNLDRKSSGTMLMRQQFSVVRPRIGDIENWRTETSLKQLKGLKPGMF